MDSETEELLFSPAQENDKISVEPDQEPQQPSAISPDMDDHGR